jgi:Ca2+-binding RTX toxin-like protein
LRPDTGKDRVFGGDGDDVIHAFGGGKRDRIDCGPGNDTAFVDRRERKRTVNCEAVRHG